MYFFAFGHSQAQQTKEVTELSSEELETANSICKKALEDYFGDRIKAWIANTLFYLPASDADEDQVSTKLKKLRYSITVFSVEGVAIAYRNDVKSDLKKRIAKLGASYKGKKYRILKSLVILEPGGGGGNINMILDRITVIPYTVFIY